MFRVPQVIGILSFRDGPQDKKMTSFVFKNILEFEIVKSSDDMASKAYVKLPNNLSYSTQTKRPSFSKPLEDTLSDIPTDFESSIQKFTSGLQVWDSNYNTKNVDKPNYWVDIASISGKPSPSPLGNGDINLYYGQRYSYTKNMDWKFFRTLKRDGIEYDKDTTNKESLQVSKVYPKNESNLISLFKIGDLFTLRWVYQDGSNNPTYTTRSGPIGPKTSFLNQENFYISNIKNEGNHLILELEGWTWMMRQIPCRLSLQKPISILEFLETYIMPVILKSTYIDSIVTRDSGGNLDDNSFGSFPTENLLNNKIGPVRINITNMYDLLVTLKHTYLINFTETQWAQPHGLYLSLGYGYRKALFKDISPSFYKKYAAALAKQEKITNPSVFLYQPGFDCASVNLTKINFNAYSVLVRITSNNTFNKLAKNKTPKTIVSTTDRKGVKSLTVENVQKNQIEVVYGDRKAYGMISDSNDTLGGKTIIRSQDNDNANIINIKLVGIKDKNYLRTLAKKTYNKLKFANSINSLGVKPFFTLGRIPSIFEVVTVENRLDKSLTGDYITTETRIVINKEDGYLIEVGLGLRLGITGQSADGTLLIVDDVDGLIKNEKD
jgi:hypothetical protein